MARYWGQHRLACHRFCASSTVSGLCSQMVVENMFREWKTRIWNLKFQKSSMPIGGCSGQFQISLQPRPLHLDTCWMLSRYARRGVFIHFRRSYGQSSAMPQVHAIANVKPKSIYDDTICIIKHSNTVPFCSLLCRMCLFSGCVKQQFTEDSG